jgi:hypothetical protein
MVSDFPNEFGGKFPVSPTAGQREFRQQRREGSMKEIPLLNLQSAQKGIDPFQRIGDISPAKSRPVMASPSLPSINTPMNSVFHLGGMSAIRGGVDSSSMMQSPSHQSLMTRGGSQANLPTIFSSMQPVPYDSTTKLMNIIEKKNGLLENIRKTLIQQKEEDLQRRHLVLEQKLHKLSIQTMLQQKQIEVLANPDLQSMVACCST